VVFDEAQRQVDPEIQKAIDLMLKQPRVMRKARRLKRKVKDFRERSNQ